MDRQVLKDQYFRIIGYIETDSSGDLILKDSYFKVLGKYVKKQDVTKDFYGKIVGRGNILTSLLPPRK